MKEKFDCYCGPDKVNQKFLNFVAENKITTIFTSSEWFNFVSADTILRLTNSNVVVASVLGDDENNFHINNSSKNQVQELWTTRMGEICKENNKKEITTIILVQPMLGSGNKQLSTDEKILLEYSGVYIEDSIDILNKMAGSLVELENICHGTYDLRMIFDDVKEPLLFDHLHVNDLGNEIVAEEIYEILINHL